MCVYSFFSQYIYAKPNQVDVVKGVFIPWCDNCTQGAVEQVCSQTVYVQGLGHSLQL